jgi:hypothetical protein
VVGTARRSGGMTSDANRGSRRGRFSRLHQVLRMQSIRPREKNGPPPRCAPWPRRRAKRSVAQPLQDRARPARASVRLCPNHGEPGARGAARGGARLGSWVCRASCSPQCTRSDCAHRQRPSETSPRSSPRTERRSRRGTGTARACYSPICTEREPDNRGSLCTPCRSFRTSPECTGCTARYRRDRAPGR